MSDKHYEIYYLGSLLPGIAAEDAAKGIAKLFKLDEEKAIKLIHSSARTLKSGLSQEQADKYQQHLSNTGLRVEVRGGPETAASEPALEPMEETAHHSAATEETESTTTEDTELPVEFHGQGFEYFKIWITNIFLTILTLGIYSAWAKVRNKQYFYGNTLIDGVSFNYTAKPITILKGRLIAVAVFIVYSVISELLPLVGVVLALVFLFALPWLITRALAFNAQNSTYRNIRFNFQANYWDAFKIFLLWPLILIPTLFLALPYIWYRQKQFLVEHSSYGTTHFEFHATAKDYFRIFLICLGLLIGASIIIGILSAILGPDVGGGIGSVLMIPVYLALFGYFTAATGNLLYNSTTISEHSFHCELEPTKIALLYFTNTLGIVCSLGLLIPWAQVRMMRYRAECLTFVAAGSLDQFAAAEQENLSALGEQLGEVFDVDIAVI